ncbi:glutathione S-transferase family protein [Halocynthiibacter sp.]|uniref:glutathione S-transferase family protein n=1 Tax=Halocynthiibacter sp. TaxID=1979210 RepID=UPI003C5EB91A
MIRLHHAPQARSMRVIWVLEELGLDYELVSYNFFDKSLRSEEYKALNPAGRVPAMEIGAGQVICESGAAVEYLVELNDGALSRKPGTPERAQYLDLLHYAETIGQHCANLTQAHIVLYQDWMKSPTQMGLEAKRLAVTLKRLEAQLADGREWMLTSGFSAVDCALAYGVFIGEKFTSLDAMPNLSAWWDRFKARPSFAKALPQEGEPLIYRKDFYPPPEVVKPEENA